MAFLFKINFIEKLKWSSEKRKINDLIPYKGNA